MTEIDDPPRLVMADLHNHSLLSDGRGDPEQAFAMMRASGLQVAALTDHSALPRELLPLLSLQHYPDAAALELARFVPDSIDDAAWLRTAELADAHDVPGQFTALRGFEWTEAWLGHVNVWFSERYAPMTSPGSLSGLFAFLQDVEPQALFGYNHPGREPGSLGDFARPVEPDSAGPSCETTTLRRRMVSLEAFNRSDDYLFAGSNSQTGSAIVTCLDAGWRPTLAGASDEHGRSYGLAGKGRTGLWVHEHSRSGVREALLARRGFATREVGLRLHATLEGRPDGLGGGGLGDGGGDLGRGAARADGRPGPDAAVRLVRARPGIGRPRGRAAGDHERRPGARGDHGRGAGRRGQPQPPGLARGRRLAGAAGGRPHPRLRPAGPGRSPLLLLGLGLRQPVVPLTRRSARATWPSSGRPPRCAVTADRLGN